MTSKKKSRIKGERREYSVVLIKPDGVRRKIVGDITFRFERIGFRLAAAKLIWVDSTLIGKHYRDDRDYHRSMGERTLENYKKYGLDPGEKLGTSDPVKIGKLIRKWNMEFLSSGPVFAMLWEGPDVVSIIRKVVGSTFPSESLPGTIRGDYSYESPILANSQLRSIENLVHASGSKKEAEFERKLWFKEDEIYDY
jgi:nucleoside-diphosphate kinase